MVRNIHRWLSLPFFFFILVVVVTGVYLQFVELDHGLKPKKTVATVPSIPSEGLLLADLEKALKLAKATNEKFPTQKIQLQYKGEQKVVTFSTNARLGPSMTVNLTTEKVKEVTRPPRTLRTYFLLFHSGKFFGTAGTVVLLLSGLALLILSVTGIWEYVKLYNRRKKAGKKELFW